MKARAIDRVDDPGVIALAAIAPLLADNGVVGKGISDDAANSGFGAAVGLGDRVKTGGEFVVDAQIGPEQWQGSARGSIGGG